MATWTIEEKDGQFTVAKGRIRKSFSSQDKALEYIREHRAHKDQVVQVDQDGYRTPLTRGRWRRPGLDL